MQPGLRPTQSLRDLKPPEVGSWGADSWVQLGMTQPVTPTESFPLGSLPASVSLGRVVAGNRPGRSKQPLQTLQMEAASCPAPPNQRCSTPGALGTVFPGSLAIKCQSPYPRINSSNLNVLSTNLMPISEQLYPSAPPLQSSEMVKHKPNTSEPT